NARRISVGSVRLTACCAATAAVRSVSAARNSTPRFIGSTCPMIGMPCKDTGGAVELFEQHGPREEVRPGGLAECDQQVRFVPLCLRMAVRSPDHKARFTDPTVTPFLELGGKLFGGQVAPALIEQDRANRRQRIGDTAAPFGQL